MAQPVDLPKGPSGRIPLAQLELAEIETSLVVFDDGAIGKMQENAAPSSDGSQYSMITYSSEQLAKIEKRDKEEDIEVIFLRLLLIINILYLGLFLFVRENSEWPNWINTTGDWKGVLIFFPPIILYYLAFKFSNFSEGEIIVFPVNSDPHYFLSSSKNSETISWLIGSPFGVGIGCLFSIDGGELYCDAGIILLLLMTAFIHVRERNSRHETILRTGEKTQSVGLQAFFDIVLEIQREQKKKDRVENSLLNLLMDNESPTLEFKSSIWTQYHGVTGVPVSEQKSPMLELEDSVVKTVAAFLNTQGGTLLIGVKDKPRSSGDAVAEVLGIEPDFRWTRKKDEEGIQHSLIEIFRNAYSNTNSMYHITISFPTFEDKLICRIDVEPLPRKLGQQCYTNTKKDTKYGKKELFFARIADTTENMSPSTQWDYIRHHFEGFSGKNNES